jgi:hypothetical protein
VFDRSNSGDCVGVGVLIAGAADVIVFTNGREMESGSG